MGESYTKTNVSSVLASVDTNHWDFTVNSGVVHDHADFSFPTNDSFTGSYNPGWKSLIRAGVDASTSMTGIKYRQKGSNFFSYQRYGTYPNLRAPNQIGYECFGNAPFGFANPNLSPSAGLMNEVRNRAIRKFLESAKSVRSSFEAGQDLGELKQTIGSFRRPFESMKKLTVEYLLRLKKAKVYLRDIRSLRKALSDSYLEWRFGWRPLVIDIADAYAGLTNRNRMQSTAPCHGNATGQELLNSHVGAPTFGFDSKMILSESTYITYSYWINGAIRLNLNRSGNIPVLQSLQLSTLNDFAVTAWDLLPYSFVVDYLVNVGDIINALTFPFSDLTYCCATEKTVITGKSSLSLVKVADSGGVVWNSQSLNPANSMSEIVKVSRARLQSLDLIPSVRFALPSSFRPYENVAALISSNYKGLVPYF